MVACRLLRGLVGVPDAGGGDVPGAPVVGAPVVGAVVAGGGVDVAGAGAVMVVSVVAGAVAAFRFRATRNQMMSRMMMRPMIHGQMLRPSLRSIGISAIMGLHGCATCVARAVGRVAMVAQGCAAAVGGGQEVRKCRRIRSCGRSCRADSPARRELAVSGVRASHYPPRRTLVPVYLCMRLPSGWASWRAYSTL
jgi:hypothetical protein